MQLYCMYYWNVLAVQLPEDMVLGINSIVADFEQEFQVLGWHLSPPALARIVPATLPIELGLDESGGGQFP